MEKMTIEKLCNLINMPMDVLKPEYISRDEEIHLKRLFESDEERFYEVLETHERKYEIVLYLYVKWAAESFGDYKKAGISDQIYIDNYKDLKIWYLNCIKTTGIQGMKEYRWTSLPIKRKIYRLGRLQFEMSKLRENIEVGTKIYNKGEKILEVHIPEGEPLTEKRVSNSFQMAQDFFAGTIKYDYKMYYCESWLLSPHLKELLSVKSNILKFQSLFRVYKEVESRQAEERVFGIIEDQLENYPEKTSLQKQMKEYLRMGHRVGMGHGIILPGADWNKGRD